jgi:hypothetical protein
MIKKNKKKYHNHASSPSFNFKIFNSIHQMISQSNYYSIDDLFNIILALNEK